MADAAPVVHVVTVSSAENELRKEGLKNMMERIQGAMRALLASTIVQCCEAVDENLAHWLKGSIAARRERT
jgi:hypothetical protein